MLDLFKQIIHKEKENSSLNESDRNNLYSQLDVVLTNQSPLITSQNDRVLIKKVQSETMKYNLNNITRTEAYLQFYNRHKEVHWAFLAHMVSRNGGYNMSDLKGSLIGDLIEVEKKKTLFHFLERANALIFHDAYPQLLLYEESLKENKSLFYLLPAFHITSFMIPIWEHFIIHSNSTLLTLALITNEQHYVEKHLMSKETTKQLIFNTFTYIVQEKLGFTHVAFPYKRYPFLRNYSLAGIKVHEFSSVKERILIGKRLYSILFSKLQNSPILHFANEIHHTGSRSDYWPHLFSSDHADTKKVYSPLLLSVWNQVPHQFLAIHDWFTDLEQVNGFEIELTDSHADITNGVKRDMNLLLTLGKIKNEIPSIPF